MDYSTSPMIAVFDLREELQANPQRVALTQALTLNPHKPQMGLRGAHGLFGSEEWWSNLETGAIPTKRFSGIIQKAYCASQGESGPNNMIDILTDEGIPESVGIYVTDPCNVRLFQKGHRVEIVYVLDELKKQPAADGSVNCSRVALSMAVSLQPL